MAHLLACGEAAERPPIVRMVDPGLVGAAWLLGLLENVIHDDRPGVARFSGSTLIS